MPKIVVKSKDTKKCTGCQKVLPSDSFWHRDSKRKKRRSKCKKCHAQSIKKAQTTFRLKMRYGMTIACYEELAQKQGWACAICGYKSTKNGKRDLYIDHCHTTNEVRGLLCNSCNLGLGNFKDNIGCLKNAVKYLS